MYLLTYIHNLVYIESIFFQRPGGSDVKRAKSRAGGRVWAGWARAHPLFGRNRVKHMVGPNSFLSDPTHFLNPSVGPG